MAPRNASDLVLLHGRGHAGAMWFPVLPALESRHRVLAPDLPGFGARVPAAAVDRGADGETALRFFVDPIEDLLLRRASAGVTLIGHSLGGLVAVELALRGRVSIARLVLLDAMGLGPQMTFASRVFFRLGPERLARVLGRRMFERLNPGPKTPLGLRVAELEYQLLTVRGGRAAARIAFNRLCPWFGPVFHRRQELARITAPTLILWGDRDAALPVANANAAVARMPAATLVRLPCGHSPHLEQPEAVLRHLVPFLG
ncbi:MAG TPA: alpha/beta hydrolase [Polyangia bacterium]|jgi:pimeloyl-ACP methyl ester carboxylesterase|nr:alpha/beta hydrolase [Polyangia bacterium]